MNNIKEIISKFIKLEPNEINESTIIDKSAVNSSILIHRLYAELSKIGVEISNPKSIRTFGDLLMCLDKNSNNSLLKQEKVNLTENKIQYQISGIGVDIESVSNLPITDDFRNEKFYLENFTINEISYCILKDNPYKNFTTIFSLKEAIYKANNNFIKTRKFNEIEIIHNPNGKPELKGFLLTSSYSEGIVVSVAIALV
jgi:phosphopantetheine--protein transferase-like protein